MKKQLAFVVGLILLGLFPMSCMQPQQQTSSDSGIQKATAKITVDPATGLSAEQWNIEQKITRDNEPGAIKHLYIISPYSGECILYSTVKGKVTSGNKRLSPKTVNSREGWSNIVTINGQSLNTDEILGDDGSYGESNPYIFWIDAQGRYQQFYPGNAMVFISDAPVAVKSVTINMALSK